MAQGTIAKEESKEIRITEQGWFGPYPPDGTEKRRRATFTTLNQPPTPLGAYVTLPEIRERAKSETEIFFVRDGDISSGNIGRARAASRPALSLGRRRRARCGPQRARTGSTSPIGAAAPLHGSLSRTARGPCRICHCSTKALPYWLFPVGCAAARACNVRQSMPPRCMELSKARSRCFFPVFLAFRCGSRSRAGTVRRSLAPGAVRRDGF